ncbi:hypothetical protein [Luteolibacter soli]|uniref:DUF975 family protein n=1 Tax=Luteolibacter soli TaxID=3135280 RepID=A0ABU9AYE4_9BACT
MKFARSKNPDDVLAEKNLWQIYLASLGIPDSIFNWIVAVLAGVVAGGFAFIQNGEKILEAIQDLANLGFNSAVSLLGFLIAGFTIFAASASPSLLQLMLRKRHKKTQLIYLKYNFFTIVRVFIYFLAFAMFQLCIIAFGKKEGVFQSWATIFEVSEDVRMKLVQATFIMSVMFWAFVMMQLKSFVFNVYHFAMTMIKAGQIEHAAKNEAP